VYGRILRGMTPLERFTSMNQTHDAVLEAVVYLEKCWGHGARVADLAELLSFPEVAVRTYLDELAEVGVVIWEPRDSVAWYADGVPVLGEVP
jgi:Mn-dependent DtxR family transcriptional regulator